MNRISRFANGLSRNAKGKLGEAITTIEYGLQGWIDKGNAHVGLGRPTPNTGQEARAVFDHYMESIFGGSKIAESKFNKGGLTRNQKEAIGKGAEVDLSITTATDVGGAVAGQGGAIGAAASSSEGSGNDDDSWW